MPVIYVDVLFLINFIVDALLLICTLRLGGFRINYLRSICAAALGGIYSVFIFFPSMPDLLLAFSKLAAASAMILIAAKIRSIYDFLRGVLCFYISNFLLGGVLTSLMYFTSVGAKTNALLSNGSIYFNIKLPTLISVSVTVTAAVYFISYEIKSQLRRSPCICRVIIGFGGKTVKTDGFIDTGNKLTSPGGGVPVAVAEYSLIEGLLDENTAHFIKNGDIASLYEFSANLGRFTLIPYSAVGTDVGFLIGFSPEIFLINDSPAADCIIAICCGKLGKSKIILNPDVLT